ncbi:hypothetical protein QQ045_020281 [Rhodiola kirilowii]
MKLRPMLASCCLHVCISSGDVKESACLARVCILPKSVIQAVNSICARFLWRGNCDKKGGHLVKWDQVCKEKEEGGLGLKNLEVMNCAMVLNQMWGKKGGRPSLWSEWLEKYWRKGKHWWEEEVKAKSSWVLKRMMHLEWHNLVWNDFNAPRDSINAWLAVQNKLMTRDRMCKWGWQGEKTCVLCEVMEENRDHILFECSYSKEVWFRVLYFLKVKSPFASWEALLPWFLGLPQVRLKTKLIAAAATRIINGLWRARNMKIFREESIPAAVIVQEAIFYLKMKKGALKKEAFPKEDVNWLKSMRFID